MSYLILTSVILFLIFCYFMDKKILDKGSENYDPDNDFSAYRYIGG